MQHEPPEPATCHLLQRWAGGDPAALDALAARCARDLCAKLGASRAAVEVAARRVLERMPRFVVKESTRLEATMAVLIADELAAGATRAAREPVAGSVIVLDLDRGAVVPASQAEADAWLKLALLLLAPADRRLLLAHWARLGEPTPQTARAAQCHEELVRLLRRGALEEALRARAAPSPPSDLWGTPTEWSMVLGAAAKDGSRVHQSWRRLLDRYRDPIALAIRRALRGSPGGGDLADEFFSYLFEHDVLSKTDPGNGRFRAYIQAVLKRFLLKRRRGQRDHAELDEQAAPGVEAADLAAERADESAWAAHVLRLALVDLLARSPRDGDVLVRYYGIPWPDPDSVAEPQSREQLAAAFGTTLGAIDQAAYRARAALRACIERELRETVLSAADHVVEVEVVVQRLLEAYPGL